MTYTIQSILIPVGYGLATFLIVKLFDIIASKLKGGRGIQILSFVLATAATIAIFGLSQSLNLCFPACNPPNSSITLFAVSLSLLRWYNHQQSQQILDSTLKRILFMAFSTWVVVFIGLPTDLAIAIISLNLAGRVTDWIVSRVTSNHMPSDK